MKHYDLVIVGGGMAGLTLLAAIEPAIRLGLSVTLIDPAPKPQSHPPQSPSFDDRATALSGQALETFHTLGMAGIEEHLSNITDIEVSDRGHVGYHQMSATSQQRNRYGAVIANRAMGALLWQRCQNMTVDFRFEQQARAIQPLSNGHRLTLNQGEIIETGLLILCDGGRSTLIEQLGFQRLTHSFHAKARVATVRTEQPHLGRAFERFTGQGPVAMLPFGAFSALVWTIPEQLAAHYPETKTDAVTWLNQHFGQRLGRIDEISDWQEYPLEEKRLNSLACHHCLILGNAAATLHPVAGQGFNLAIRGIVRAAKQINHSYTSGQNLPDFATLNQLSQTILNDQENTVFASRKLIDLFNSSNPLIQLGRGIGLNSLDRHPSFSQLFALAGMGYAAGAPALNG
ncbi:MAG: FAD-dependent monooxygenase [Reinekea sp.]